MQRLALRAGFAGALIGPALVPYTGAQTLLWGEHGASGGDRYGLCISAVGDANGDTVPDVVVGAPFSDLGGSSSGAGYILSGLDGSLIHPFPGEAPGDSMGFCVAGVGDVDGDGLGDVLLGSRFSDVAGLDFGRATVWSGATGALIHGFNGTSPNGRFGEAVGAAGDVNGDGRADLIVGARLHAVGGSPVGRAVVYSGLDGSVLYTIDGDDSSDFFGRAVGTAGDVNADGFDDFLVGAPGDDDGGNLSGSMTVFSGATGAVLYKFDGDGPGDQMGVKVAPAGDVDRDGHADMIVGIPGSDFGGSDLGAARVFSGATGAILYTFTGATDHGEFGSAVDGAGDVNGDGWPDLLVGGRLEDTLALDTGSATIFSGFDGSVLHVFDGVNPGDEFGDTAVGMGDVNGDGFGDVLIGAFGDDVNGSGSGSVFAFSGRDVLGGPICDGVPNTTGASATVAAEGSIYTYDNDVILSVQRLPVGVNGYFLTSPDAGFLANPGGSTGNLCIASFQIGRYAGDVLTSDARGVATLQIDLTAVPLPAGSMPVAAGDTRYWQFWYRDANTSNFSEAVGLIFQ